MIREPRPDRRFEGLETTVFRGLVIPVAASLRSRMLGLAFLDRDRAGEGLVIPRCRSIHTCGMRFPIDVHFLDRTGRVVHSVFGVGPGRLLHRRGAEAVVELPSVPVGGRDSVPAD